MRKVARGNGEAIVRGTGGPLQSRRRAGGVRALPSSRTARYAQRKGALEELARVCGTSSRSNHTSHRRERHTSSFAQRTKDLTAV